MGLYCLSQALWQTDHHFVRQQKSTDDGTFGCLHGTERSKQGSVPSIEQLHSLTDLKRLARHANIVSFTASTINVRLGVLRRGLCFGANIPPCTVNMTGQEWLNAGFAWKPSVRTKLQTHPRQVQRQDVVAPSRGSVIPISEIYPADRAQGGTVGCQVLGAVGVGDLAVMY